jgi:hypothetical protein
MGFNSAFKGLKHNKDFTNFQIAAMLGDTTQEKETDGSLL